MKEMNGKYGNQAKMAGNPAPEMVSKGSVKNNIPKAMTNMVGADKNLMAANLAVWRMSMTASAIRIKRKPTPRLVGGAY